jgi:hypothetical protein
MALNLAFALRERRVPEGFETGASPSLCAGEWRQSWQSTASSSVRIKLTQNGRRAPFVKRVTGGWAQERVGDYTARWMATLPLCYLRSRLLPL